MFIVKLPTKSATTNSVAFAATLVASLLTG